MGIFSFFKRKKEGEIPEFNPSDEASFRDAGPPIREPDFQQFQPDLGTGVSQRDIELVLSKLEIINRKLDDIDKRIQYIEKVAKESQ